MFVYYVIYFKHFIHAYKLVLYSILYAVIQVVMLLLENGANPQSVDVDGLLVDLFILFINFTHAMTDTLLCVITYLSMSIICLHLMLVVSALQL